MKTLETMKNLPKNEIVNFYDHKEYWEIEEIKEFENRLIAICDEDDEYYWDNLCDIRNGAYNDKDCGCWQTETRNCDSWGSLQNAIEKFFNSDTDELAKDEKIDFLQPFNNDHLLFNSQRLERHLKKLGFFNFWGNYD